MYLGLGHVAILEIKGGEADAWIVELQGLSDA
jgi:hypothetical protein